MCHDEPELLRRVALALRFKEDRLFVHVDKNADISRFLSEAENLPNVTFVKNRVEVYWGGFQSIVATMNTIREIFETKIRYSRFVLLQGKDYPLKSPQCIHSFFEQRPLEEFCKGKNITSSDKPGDYMKICGYWHMDAPRTVGNIFLRKILAFFNTVICIKYRKGYFKNEHQRWDIYKGWAHFALTERCAKYILNVYETNHSFNLYMKHRFPPDEIYIHTLIYNSPFRDYVSQFKIYSTEGKDKMSQELNLTYFEYPDVVTVFRKKADYYKLLKTNALFVRKVKLPESKELLDEIDKAIERLHICPSSQQ